MTLAEPSTLTTDLPARPRQAGGIKETIESILVAFILAFVFRAFVVEAFVIPTGSMATTLLGAHTRFHCPDCGYRFDLNYSNPSNPTNESDEGNVPDTAGKILTPIYCPNCGFQMPAEQTDNPPIFYGDRILVLKYLYLLQEPRRWDVVVFKPPGKLSENYIKRMVGKPNEAVMVLDGDVYIRKPGAGPRDFEVQAKPADVQQSMWRLVYDNDFHPESGLDRSVGPWQQPWTVVEGRGWNLDVPQTRGRSFNFSNPAGASKLRFDPGANPTAQTLSDYLVHDQNTLRLPARSAAAAYPQGGDIPVSDLDVRLTYRRTSGTGPLQVMLTKRDHVFRAVISPTRATLFMDAGGSHYMIGQPFPLPAGDGPTRIELSNADYHAALRINDKVTAETAPSDYAPNLTALIAEYNHPGVKPPPGRVEISADQQDCDLSHLSLYRDLYYYNHDQPPVLGGVQWATPKDFPNGAQPLGPDEYFTMGDNSLVSYDARCWTADVNLPAEDLQTAPGKVPGRFLLGKAFYVYWPAGHSAWSWLPALVPNFESMRFIH